MSRSVFWNHGNSNYIILYFDLTYLFQLYYISVTQLWNFIFILSKTNTQGESLYKIQNNVIEYNYIKCNEILNWDIK